MGILSKKICQGRVVFSLNALSCFCFAFLKTKSARNALINKFEACFARYVGAKYAIGVSSAKIALVLSLQGLGAKDGDEIIVPAYTVPEVIEVIILLKLVPVFIDINLRDGTLDPDLVEKKIGKKTRFILPTHMYGNLFQAEQVLAIARKYDLLVIEDAAQACGGEYKGQKTGSLGKVGYFSFGLIKNLNTLGGGMIVTDDETLAQKIRELIGNFKPISRMILLKRLLTACMLSFFTHPFVFSIFIYPLFYLGLNRWKNKLSSFIKSKKLNACALEKLKVCYSGEQASLGLFQLGMLDEFNDDKIKKANLLNEYLSEIKGIELFEAQAENKNIYLNYVIRVKDRQKLMRYLFANGIDIIPGFVINCAQRNDFKKFESSCPQSSILERENLYLPIYDPLTQKDIAYMGELIRNYFIRSYNG